MSALAERWCQSLAAIADLKLRTDYIRAQFLSYGTSNLALGLREVFERAAMGYDRAQRVVAAVVPALAHSEADTVRGALMAFAVEGAWDDLCDWLGCQKDTDDAPAGEDPTNAGLQNVARGSGDRPLTLGERKSLARQPSTATLARLLRDPDPSVIEVLLDNPAITEDRVIRLTARRPGHAQVLRLIAAHPVWCGRPRIRAALIQNPGTPSFISAPLVCLIGRPVLDAVLEIPRTAPWVRRAAARASRSRSDIPLAGD